MRGFACTLLIVLMGAGCSANAATIEAVDAEVGTQAADAATDLGDLPDPSSAEQDVVALFDEYRRALLRRDGAAAFDLVTASTFDYYDRVLEAGVSARADDLLESMPISEALAVLAVRARVGSNLLAVADGEELFRIGVDEGLIGDNVASLQFDRIDIDGAQAFGVAGGTQAMRFEYTGRAWLVDLPFTADFLDDNEDVLIESLTGDVRSRKSLFEIVSIGYGTTWDDLASPLG